MYNGVPSETDMRRNGLQYVCVSVVIGWLAQFTTDHLHLQFQWNCFTQTPGVSWWTKLQWGIEWPVLSLDYLDTFSYRIWFYSQLSPCFLVCLFVVVVFWGGGGGVVIKFKQNECKRFFKHISALHSVLTYRSSVFLVGILKMVA